MTASKPLESHRIYTLQAGRALAALAVVIHHSSLASRDFAGVAYSVLEYGWIGVDFFFVLSGYIIAYSAPGKTIADYGWHRLRRVFPPYLPIGIAIALFYTFLPITGGAARDWNWLPTLTLLPVGEPALTVAWTLQHELVFYALFALAWFTRALWLLPLWGGLCLLGIKAIPFAPINLEFLMGIGTYLAVRKGFTSPWLLLAAIPPIAFWIALGADRVLSPFVGLSFALALPAIVGFEQRGLQVPRLLIFLGAASYSIYLVHGIAISLAARVSLSLLTCFVTGTVAGILYYLVVEKPALALFRRRGIGIAR